MELKLNKEDINKFKDTLIVHTDGCFCGHAFGEIGELLGHKIYLTFYFSCRKSMSCNNSYYEITNQELYMKDVNPHNTELSDLGSYYEEECLPENMYYPTKYKLAKKSYMKCQEILKEYYEEHWYGYGEIELPYFDV